MRHAIRADQCWTRPAVSGPGDGPEVDPFMGCDDRAGTRPRDAGHVPFAGSPTATPYVRSRHPRPTDYQKALPDGASSCSNLLAPQ